MKTITLDNGKKVRISEESYEALVEAASDKSIPVPESCGLGFRFWPDKTDILFRSGKSRIYSKSDFYQVLSTDSFVYPEHQAKLEPFDADTQDTEVGQVYVVGTGASLYNYELIINDSEAVYLYFDDGNLSVNTIKLRKQKYNWKVVTA